jgi:hypothetical protein
LFYQFFCKVLPVLFCGADSFLEGSITQSEIVEVGNRGFELMQVNTMQEPGHFSELTGSFIRLFGCICLIYRG